MYIPSFNGRQWLTLLLMAGALVNIFPFDCPVLNWWSAHAFQVAFGYLILGLLFMILRKERLMFVCLGCSAAICFYQQEIMQVATPDALQQVIQSIQHNGM